MKTFLVRTGLREVGRRQAYTAQQALLDYARSMGCQDDEIMRLGPDAVSWRGAVYHAVPLPDAADLEVSEAEPARGR
jgi:hypothetical protein